MIISRTPFRVSFFGGGTDYPVWFKQHGGAVLSTTIDKYCYISVRRLPPFFGQRHRIVWSHVELVDRFADILHPAVREGLRFLEFNEAEGLELHHQGDLPARTGMGTSSSFSVGLIKALHGLRGGAIEKHELAMKAIFFEQEVLKENVGSQDQVAAAYGGLNRIDFLPDGTFNVHPLNVSPERLRNLESRLMLFYTGTCRSASEIAATLIKNNDNNEKALIRMREMVDDGRRVLEGSGDLDYFGWFLHDAWELKRSLSSRVSNPHVDELYALARANGALGGKLLGAGESGFMLFYVPLLRQADVLKAMRNNLHVPFKFESEGCKILNAEE